MRDAGLRRLCLLLFVLPVAALVTACGSGGDTVRSPTAEPPTPADAMAIHDIDLAQLPAVRTLVAQTGGEVDARFRVGIGPGGVIDGERGVVVGAKHLGRVG